MLTRLRVQNFKNLRDVEVYFGPLTVIAGPNGVGKSNLLDAIQFLGFTADRPLAQAARDLREPGSSNFDARKLFLSTKDNPVGPMRFEADIFLPPSAVDALGQEASTAFRFLRYELELRLSADLLSNSPIEIVQECLVPISVGELPSPLLEHFHGVVPPNGKQFDYIVRTKELGKWIEFLHDGLPGWASVVANMPDKVSTLVSRVQAGTSKTITVLQQELKSWVAFQFYPDRLSQPNSLSDVSTLTPNGENLPATLFRLAKAARPGITGSKSDCTNPVYSRIVTKLRNLVPNLHAIWINLDSASSTIYLMAEDSSGNVFHASSLSDGTLRLIALATVMQDYQSSSLVSLEEPENGFHPRNLIHLQHLLEDIIDLDHDSPRQLIISTHSPGLVALSPEDSLLFASSTPKAFSDRSPQTLRLSCLSGTWRASLPSSHLASLGDLVNFLGLAPNADVTEQSDKPNSLSVYERKDFADYRLQVES